MPLRNPIGVERSFKMVEMMREAGHVDTAAHLYIMKRAYDDDISALALARELL